MRNVLYSNGKEVITLSLPDSLDYIPPEYIAFKNDTPGMIKYPHVFTYIWTECCR